MHTMPTYPDMMTGSSLEEGNSETVNVILKATDKLFRYREGFKIVKQVEREIN